MKDSGQCPKCKSYNVFMKKGSSMQSGEHLNLSKWGTKKILIDYMICSDCGFVERYVQMNAKSKKHMKSILDKQGGGFEEYV